MTTFNVPNSAADLWYVFDFDISSGFTAVNNMGSDSSFTADAFAPTISEVTAVTTPTNDNASKLHLQFKRRQEPSPMEEAAVVPPLQPGLITIQ